MSIVTAAAWCIALAVCAISLWIRWRRRRRNPFITRSGAIVNPSKMVVMPNAGEELIYVNEDGSVRELTDAEKTYVETEFSPLDGARPYIKSHYSDRTVWGIQGFLPRGQVPHGMSIHPPPQNTPQSHTRQSAADSLAQLIRRHRRS